MPSLVAIVVAQLEGDIAALGPPKPVHAKAAAFAELMAAARTPARSAAATWSRMSASSGDTINAGPAPARRCSSAEMK